MGFAALHSAAHDHRDQDHTHHHDDHDAPVDCFAFHLVAETPAAPTPNFAVDIGPKTVFEVRVEPRSVLFHVLANKRQSLPRGPPIQSSAT